MDDNKRRNNITFLIFVTLIAVFSTFVQMNRTEAPKQDAVQVESSQEESSQDQSAAESADEGSYVTYTFANEDRKQEHFEKHGKAMGFTDADEYEKYASDVVNNPDALHKVEEEDGDDVYYLESSNELVIVSTKGYIRTYFLPDDGKAYFDRT